MRFIALACGAVLSSIVPGLGAAGATSVSSSSSPMRAQHDAAIIELPAIGITSAPNASASVATGAPYRAHFGHADLYIPSHFHSGDGHYDLIVHFHGMASLQETNIERAHVNAVVVSFNIGVGSGPYEEAFRSPSAFDSLLSQTQRLVAKSGRAEGATLGRLALTAWSAGYGSVSAILRVPRFAAKVDAILLADGLHSDFRDERRHIVDDAPLMKYLRIAQSAEHDEKLFALTHSSIQTQGYPNSTETAAELLKLASVDKTLKDEIGPRGMHEIYESDRGSFHVKGFTGMGVKDHIDHIRAMNETLLPYLRDRWEKPL